MAGGKFLLAIFFITSINSTQKAELVRQCLNALENTGVLVTNFTPDGAPVNTTVKLLGCDLDPLNLNTCIASSNTFNLLDLAHMIKLVRNAFHSIIWLFGYGQARGGFFLFPSTLTA